MIEYWEDLARFDAAKLFRDLEVDSITKQILYAVFCRSSLETDARKYFKPNHLLSCQSVVELIGKLESLMQTPEFRRRSY